MTAGAGELVAPGPTVAVRIPNDPLLLQVLRHLRAPIAAPSANLAGCPPATSTAEVLETFGDRIDLVLEDDGSSKGAASTVIDCSHPVAEIVREGLVVPTAADLIFP